VSVYTQPSGLDVSAWQDNNGAEIDIVLAKGIDWAGVEIKLAQQPIVLDEAAKKLQRIAERMQRAPKFLAIVTATGPSYSRNDGVHVISIQHLAP
jgi:predicted AAA+ superfamily ATPase